MISQKLNADLDESTRQILDAVRDEVLAFGVRRATMTSIANRAEISRVTLYRRGKELKEWILDALVHEFQDYFSAYLAQAEAKTGRESVVQLCLGSVISLSKTPLLAAIRKYDPEIFLPYLVERLGRNQKMMADFLTLAIAAGIADGTIRNQDPRKLALVLILALTAFVVGPGIAKTELSETELKVELTLLINNYLESPKQQ